MKVLFLAHRIPYPPNKGDKIRALHELRALVTRGHEVHLLAFADEARDLRHRPALAELCASVVLVPLTRRRARLRALAALVGGRPLSLGYFGAPRMAAEVRRVLAEVRPDAIVPYCAPMVQYVPEEWETRCVVDLVDADSEKWRDYARCRRRPGSWLFELESRRLRRYEHGVLARVAHAVVTTEREAAVFHGASTSDTLRHLHVIPHGVDLSHYAPAPSGNRAPAGAPRFVFTGALDYYVNVEGVRYFAEEVLPLVREREPHAEFLVVGHNPTAAVRRLARRAGVTVAGFVDDERPYLGAATACVAPLRLARGIQNKVLVAMAAGCAVVASPEALAGLRVVAGRHALTGRTARELAEAAVSIAADEQWRAALGAAARRFVEAEHEWAPLMAPFVDLVESVAGRAAGRRPQDSRWRS